MGIRVGQEKKKGGQQKEYKGERGKPGFEKFLEFAHC